MNTVAIIGPVFTLLALGFFLGKTTLFPKDSSRAIIAFVWYVGIPAMMFRALASRPLPNADEMIIVLAYYSVIFILFFIAVMITRHVFKLSLTEQAIFALSTCFANGAFLGIPIMHGMYGEEGVRLLLILLSFHTSTLLPLTTIMIERGLVEGSATLHIVKKTLMSLVKNPVLVSLAVSLTWAGFSLPYTEVMDRFTELPAGAAAPCGLFAVGLSLSNVKLSGDLKQALTASFLKLLVLPSAVFVMTNYVYDLPSMWVGVCTIFASLPTGMVAYSVATQYDVGTRRAASIVLLSTTLSIITIAIVIGLIST